MDAGSSTTAPNPADAAAADNSHEALWSVALDRSSFTAWPETS